MRVQDGTGKGYEAKVDDEGQLHTRSQMHKEARHHAETGNNFLIVSGYVTSSASADQFASILYFKNDSTTKNVYVGQIRSCTEVAAKWRLYQNPTSISNSTSITPLNTNFSSAVTLDGTAEYGSSTSTTTGGSILMTWINSAGHSTQDFQGGIILGPQDSFSIEMAPFAAAAGEVCLLVEIWQILPES